MSLIQLKSVDNGGGTSTIYYYNNTTKAVTTTVISGYAPYIRATGELVDAYPVFPGTSYNRVTYDGAVGVIVTTVLNKTLLKTYAHSGVHLLNISIYDYSIRDLVQTVEGAAPASEGFAMYSISTTTIIDSYCVGTTKKEIHHDGLGGLNKIITPSSTTCGFVVPIEELQVTEKIRVAIDNSCYNNPVYLKWRNTLGGWDQWLFHTNQTVKLKTTSLGSYGKNFTDIETQDTISESRGKQAGKSIIIGADGLTDDELNGIEEVLYSKKVYMINPDLVQISVEVTDGSYNLKDTINNRHNIELEIILPEIYTITE